jgi:hypothetical protein
MLESPLFMPIIRAFAKIMGKRIKPYLWQVFHINLAKCFPTFGVGKQMGKHWGNKTLNFDLK